MIVDTSAIVAIVRDEPEADQCLNLILQTGCRISAGNLLESYLVTDGARVSGLRQGLDVIIADLHIMTEPVTGEHVQLTRDAFRRYGKGSGHAAQLNYGDCFAYALARQRDEPLLFVGSDFARTDIARAALA